MHAFSANATAAAWQLRLATAAAWPSQQGKPMAAAWCFGQKASNANPRLRPGVLHASGRPRLRPGASLARPWLRPGTACRERPRPRPGALLARPWLRPAALHEKARSIYMYILILIYFHIYIYEYIKTLNPYKTHNLNSTARRLGTRSPSSRKRRRTKRKRRRLRPLLTRRVRARLEGRLWPLKLRLRPQQKLCGKSFLHGGGRTCQSRQSLLCPRRRS